MTATEHTPAGAHMDEELRSQPDSWAHAVALGPQAALPAPGTRVAVAFGGLLDDWAHQPWG